MPKPRPAARKPRTGPTFRRGGAGTPAIMSEPATPQEAPPSERGAKAVPVQDKAANAVQLEDMNDKASPKPRKPRNPNAAPKKDA